MLQLVGKTKIEQFFSEFQVHKYAKGELILHPNENQDVFFLKKGSVRVYGISDQGIEITIHIFVPGSYFPMMSIIADIPNRYYYEALDDVRLSIAPRDKVLPFLKENPDVLLDLTKRIFIGLDKLTARIEYLSYGKASEKLASILLYLARHFGEEKNRKIYIKHPFTHRDIGSMAGITRETTSREWEKLINKEVIQYDRHTIVIPDIQKVKEELSKG